MPVGLIQSYHDQSIPEGAIPVYPYAMPYDARVPDHVIATTIRPERHTEHTTHHTGRVETVILPTVSGHSLPYPTADQEVQGITRAVNCQCPGTYQHEILRRGSQVGHQLGDIISRSDDMSVDINLQNNTFRYEFQPIYHDQPCQPAGVRLEAMPVEAKQARKIRAPENQTGSGYAVNHDQHRQQLPALPGGSKPESATTKKEKQETRTGK